MHRNKKQKKGGWAKCSKCKDGQIDSDTSEDETRCRKCILEKKICIIFGCYNKTGEEMCEKCDEYFSDIQCESIDCDNHLTKEEVKSKISTCISCNGSTRCNRCKFQWDGNAQHDCTDDYFTDEEENV